MLEMLEMCLFEKMFYYGTFYYSMRNMGRCWNFFQKCIEIREIMRKEIVRDSNRESVNINSLCSRSNKEIKW
jgi:hypothetical protein